MSARSSTNEVIEKPIALGDTGVVFIAVMGPTGTGKSTFINLISGSGLATSDDLESCTRDVQPGNAFDLDGRRVVLIDTPGFDDTMRSDVDVLNMVAAFLGTLYEGGITLAGLLYFHRISDVKMGGVSTRNFKMFRKLCGERTLKNVVIVTNMWGAVDRRVGERREAELSRGKDFFKPALEKSAQMARHENTVLSAQGILRLILNNHPLPLRIQVELVDEHKGVSNTDAGGELNQELNAQIMKNEEDMRTLRKEMQQAIQDKDEETREELEGVIKQAEEDNQKLREETKKLKNGIQHAAAALTAIAAMAAVAATVMSGGVSPVDVLSGAITVANMCAGIYSQL